MKCFLLAIAILICSAANLPAECTCGAHCPGTCCDCGCSDVHQVPTQCPGGICPNCPNGQCPQGIGGWGIGSGEQLVPVGPSISPASEDPFENQATAGPLWNWTPAADYQSAVVLVRCGHDQMSGGYVKFGELTGVITAKHGIQGTSADVVFADGTKQSGQAYVDKDGNDVAFVAVTNASIVPLELAQGLAVGSQVEYVTKGGPESRLRHFSGTVAGGFGDQTRIQAHVISGDSGAPILNANHQVATVQSCGLGVATNVGTWTVYDESTAPKNEAVISFMTRVHQRLHPTGNVNVLCFGGRCQNNPPAAAGSSPLYPPATVPVAPAPVVAAPAISNQPVLDRINLLEKNLSNQLNQLPIPLGGQLDALTKKVESLPVPPNLAPLASALQDKLSSLEQKTDALVNHAVGVKQVLDQFNSTPLGQVVKQNVDSAIGPLAAKIAAPVAADLGLPALATIGVAGGIPGLIGSALLALLLKKKVSNQGPGIGGQGSAGNGGTLPGPAAPTQSPGSADQAGKTVVVATQTEPPPQQVVRDTQYVNIIQESPELQGLKMAMDEFVKRNPTLQGAVTDIKTFAKQFTSGIAPAAAANSSS